MIKSMILGMRWNLVSLFFLAITVQSFSSEIITRHSNGRLVKNQDKVNIVQWINGDLTCGELSGNQIIKLWSIHDVTPEPNLLYKCEFIGDSFFLFNHEVSRFTLNGDLIWKSVRSASAAVFDSFGCVCSDAQNNLYSLGLDGKIKWEINNIYEVALWIDDEIVISCRGFTDICVRSRESGSLLWKYDTKTYSINADYFSGLVTGLENNGVVSDKSYIYVAIGHTLISFSRSGVINYKKTFKKPFSMAPLLDPKGLLYVGTEAGVYCIANTGKIVWSDESGRGYDCACLDDTGRLFCGGLGTVAVYEGGKLREEIKVEGSPEKIIYANGVYFIDFANLGRISGEEITKRSLSPPSSSD